jgi:hypothetical protein
MRRVRVPPSLRNLSIVAVTAAAGLTACGSPDHVAGPNATDDSETAPHSGQTSVSNAFDLDVNPDDGIPCDLGGVLPPVHVAVQANAISQGEPFANDSGYRALTLEVEYDPSTIVEFRPLARGSATDVIQDLHRVLVTGSQFVDQRVLNEMLAMQKPILMIHYREVGSSQVRPELMLAASRTQGIDLLGECGEVWNRALEVGARSLGKEDDLSFLQAVADWSSPAATAVGEAMAAPALTWEATPPSQRSLNVRDVPRTHISDYYLAAVFVQQDGLVPPGMISFRSGSGVISTFLPSGISGVVPMLIPRKEESTTVVFIPDQRSGSDEEVIKLGELSLSLFDESLGTLVRVSADGGGPVEVRASPLEPGELEQRMGLTRADIEKLRSEILQ